MITKLLPLPIFLTVVCLSISLAGNGLQLARHANVELWYEGDVTADQARAIVNFARERWIESTDTAQDQPVSLRLVRSGTRSELTMQNVVTLHQLPREIEAAFYSYLSAVAEETLPDDQLVFFLSNGPEKKRINIQSTVFENLGIPQD